MGLKPKKCNFKESTLYFKRYKWGANTTRSATFHIRSYISMYCIMRIFQSFVCMNVRIFVSLIISHTQV